MSLPFQPVADSSDDEPVALTTWQKGPQQRTNPQSSAKAGSEETGTGAYWLDNTASLPKPKGPPSAFRSVQPASRADTSEDEDDALATLDELAEDKLRESNSARNYASQQDSGEDNTPERIPAASGFTPINAVQRKSTGSGGDSRDRNTANPRSKIAKIARVRIPVTRITKRRGLEDVVDYTRGGDIVRKIEQEAPPGDSHDRSFWVEFMDYHVEKVTVHQLQKYDNGIAALEVFDSEVPQQARARQNAWQTDMTERRASRKSKPNFGFVSTVDAVPLSDDEEDSTEVSRQRSRKRKVNVETLYENRSDSETGGDSLSLSEDDRPTRNSRLRARTGTVQPSRRTRYSTNDTDHLVDDESDSGSFRLSSDIRRDTKPSLRLRAGKRASAFKDDDGFDLYKRGSRQSGRSTRHQGDMQEVGETNIYRSDSDEAARTPRPKNVGMREVFKPLPRNDEFRMRHIQDCERCGQGNNFAPLVYCQGCTLAYHKSCLGHRTNREHLVTKIGDDDFVLQCRRCVAIPRKKDHTAPDQGKCSDCRRYGHACRPFRPRKTTAQEQKEREENDGEDPIYDVDQSLINQADKVLFRCFSCWRAFHFEHLPSRSDVMDLDSEVDADQRFREYSRDWKCKDCLTMPAKPSGLIAWKPVDEDNYDGSLTPDNIDEDEKAYLVKWDGMSYFRACWMPGAWVWGVTVAAMRKAFSKREEAQHPKMRTEDAIPEDFLRADIVLDIKFTSIVDIRTEEVDKARIREVDKALIKYKGLGYEDAVWEAPPTPEDGDRWTDFVLAYNDWVLGRYVRQPRTTSLKQKLEKARQQDFTKLEKKQQPDNLNGGELMKYQVEGLNWLYYKWFTEKNAILADEMGLGKTIQIIGFLATLIQDWNCYPFLVVVPNSTCPNWRREIKRWAPSLRVVAYYGSRESRDLAYRYELYPENSKDLRCHIVVTSYDAASDEKSHRFFKSVSWQGLIVDEGQRLKNEKTLLYHTLGTLKTPFKILLTGTPLQNNQRELFNLLQFLDDSFNAAHLEEEYMEATLDSAKISELHNMIKPFFLRRTKAQVLTFLPPMSQIIVPVSMSIVQKKLYRTILAKNPELMKAIFSPEQNMKQGERASLNNMLMQLRRCLCHPFVYNKSIEERNVDFHASHRNLVDASCKLSLLELLLPKLKERGHRVLIFSQFLDMLDVTEDFLDGMELRHQRLDGTISALQKQKRIDEFNAPNSPLFAFLLSTRAGGVGINLATADTVIILDPDFNPHQDIQALSRAHRIGQTKKVLCFQLVTRASAEERMMQMGRKKLALDHVLIQEMDADETDENDLVSVLRHGASELFSETDEQEIQYDAAGVERLLDRSHIEDTRAGSDKTAETQFSFARVWANDQGTLQEELLDEEAEMQQAPDPNVWSSILKERERLAVEEAAAKAEAFGRGRRARGNVDYAGFKDPDGMDGPDSFPAKRRKAKKGDESDTDFQAGGSDSDDDFYTGENLEQDELKDVEQIVEDDGAKNDTGRKINGKQHISLNASKLLPLPTPAASPVKTPAKKPSKPPKRAAPQAPPQNKPAWTSKSSAPSVKRPRGRPKGQKKPKSATDNPDAPASNIQKPELPSPGTDATKQPLNMARSGAADGNRGDPIVVDQSDDDTVTPAHASHDDTQPPDSESLPTANPNPQNLQ